MEGRMARRMDRDVVVEAGTCEGCPRRETVDDCDGDNNWCLDIKAGVDRVGSGGRETTRPEACPYGQDDPGRALVWREMGLSTHSVVDRPDDEGGPNGHE